MPGTGQGVPEAGESPGFWPLFFGIVFEVMLLNGKRRGGKQSSVSRFGNVAAGGCTQWPEVFPGKMVMPQHGEGSSITSEKTSQDSGRWRKTDPGGAEHATPAPGMLLTSLLHARPHPSASQAGGTCQTTRSPCLLTALPKLCLRAGAGRFEFQVRGDGSRGTALRSQGTLPPLPN